MSRQRITWPISKPAGDLFSEEDEIDLFEKHLPNTKTVFLAGVAIDTVRKMVKLAKPDVEFHIFEPDFGTYQEFRKVQLPRNVFLNPFALGAAAGTVPFFSEAQTCVKTGKNPPIKVRADTIDNYCQIRRIFRIDFLKLHTGGWEYPILLGAKTVPLRVIEFTSGPEKLKEIQQLLIDPITELAPNHYIFGIPSQKKSPTLPIKEAGNPYATEASK